MEPELEPELPFLGRSVGAESRSRLFKAALSPSFRKEKPCSCIRNEFSSIYTDTVGADPMGSEPEPELAPGPWASRAGAAQKSGGFATLNALHI